MKTAPKARRAPKPIMADQNTQIIFIWINFGTQGFMRSPITNLVRSESIFGFVIVKNLRKGQKS